MGGGPEGFLGGGFGGSEGVLKGLGGPKGGRRGGFGPGGSLEVLREP